MTNRDIIIIGQQPWDTSIGSNCKNIALQLASNNRVLYVNSPLDRITLFREKTDPKIKRRLKVIKGNENGLIFLQHNLWNLYPDCIVESINWINSTQIFNFFNKINNRKFSSSILNAIETLNFKDYILFNDNEMFKGFYLKELLKPKLSIYYSRDYMLAVDYWKHHGEHIEPQIIAKSDVCMANSKYLADYCKKYNSESYYIGQGCDLDIFLTDPNIPKPNELKDIKNKIIGYVGALQSIRLDIDIISYIAKNKPNWTIILVGPEDEAFIKSDLHNLDNVIFTGIKPISLLPVYIQYFDVCINPQLVNEVTIGNYPRKVDEYLAMGKPVVATNTPAMEVFKDYVDLANNKEDYISKINKALEADSIEASKQRKKFASTHTWENCVKLMNEIIDLTKKMN